MIVPFRSAWKRSFDFLASGCALVLLSPVLGVLIAVTRMKLGRPAIFSQTRPGLAETPFRIYKLRTMSDIKDANGALLPDAARLHPFGIFLRRTSLDELPELWNVLRGDMSLVGPRPLLMKYLPYYTNEERLRFSVRPGITGWAQINGRNEASWTDRLARDVWYVRNHSFALDLKIILMTLVKVVRREQIVVDARSIMLNLDEERAAMVRKSQAFS